MNFIKNNLFKILVIVQLTLANFLLFNIADDVSSVRWMQGSQEHGVHTEIKKQLQDINRKLWQMQ